LLLGLSAATFFLAPVVEQLLRLTPAKLYFVQHAPDRLDYLVLFGLILMIGLIAGSADWLGPRFSGPVVRRLFEAPLWLLCAVGIEHMVHQHLSRYPPLWNLVARAWNHVGLTAVDGWFITGIACSIPVLAAFSRWPRVWSSAKPILCGGAATIWLACGVKIVHPPKAIADVAAHQAGVVRPVHEIGPGNPIVWVILDEWDYDLTYKRKDGKVFPEFDRLRKQSVFLENVHAAGKITLVAIPSLLMGQRLKEYRSSSPSGAKFISMARTEPFPGPRTIFDSASQYGYRTHIVGWYHPYCRIFGAQSESCWWDDLMLPALRPGGSVADRAAAFFRDSIELELLPGIGPANNIIKQLARVDPMIDQAALAASHTGRSFSFLHLPVPHGPFFKLDSAGRMIPLPSDVAGYQSGLDAADRAVGSLRAAMERAGIWDDALIVVTSDHPYRYQFGGGYGNGHIPMMIKFPHQSMPVVSSHPFEAVETKSLIEDFMQGGLATPERALAWLERSGAPASGAAVRPAPLSVSMR
jgi:hypothetical protein